ncbi:MAG: tRNA1(Val) (adenine(37)-N6)-methyltransferase [Vallitaleaceae bacterium]|nr:tRNA1(Val) (adenine(37)-N6)-methyltransferase [Vallitaleaceae bacterium]
MIKDNERIDELNIKGYQLIQDMNGFRFGMDAVLLTGFSRVKVGEKVLDLGTGTGVIPILLEAKYPGESYIGLEIQESFVDMANRSIELNQIQDKVRIVHGDIKEADTLFPLSSFDVITSNPPYMDAGKGLTNPSSMKAIARHEVLCDLDDVLRVAGRLLKVGGRFYMVHRPHRLMGILETMKKYQLEPKRIRMVHSHLDREATMVLIEGVRQGKPMVKVEAPLIIYGADGEYTQDVKGIYES